MLYRWPADYMKTYSQNAARTRGSIIYYGALVLTFLVMFSAFVYGWLIPTLHLPRVFTAAFTVGVVAQAVAGIVPETHGWKVRTHVNAAYVMYYSTVVTVGALALSAGAPASLLIGSALLVMATAVAFGTFSAKLRSQAVALQTIHLGALAAAFMFATYVS